MQNRRPHPGMPRSAELALHQPGSFQRGFQRGAPPPPNGPQGGQFPVGGMMPASPHGAAPRMPDGSEALHSSQMMPPNSHYMGPHGQPQQAAPPMMYPG